MEEEEEEGELARDGSENKQAQKRSEERVPNPPDNVYWKGHLAEAGNAALVAEVAELRAELAAVREGLAAVLAKL